MPRTILITGVTSGLGLELSQLYSPETLILVGRKAPEELSGTVAKESYCQADLSQKNASSKIQEHLKVRGITSIDLVIHNAAVGYYGDWLEQSTEDLTALLDINLKTPIMLTQVLAPYVQAAEGKYVFINSIAAHLAAADYAVYAASKAALYGFARNLELEQEVSAQTIYLGAVRTEMHAKSGVPEGKFKVQSFPSVKDTAMLVKKTIEGRKKEQTIGFTNALLKNSGRYFGPLLDKIMRRSAKAKTSV